MSSPPSITCPDCGRTSFHPMDVAQGYCGWCHWWTSDPELARVRPGGGIPAGTAHEMGQRVAGFLKERGGDA